jgi:hypothetical protein
MKIFEIVETANKDYWPHLRKLPNGNLELIGPGSMNLDDSNFKTPTSHGVFDDPNRAQKAYKDLLRYFEKMFASSPSIVSKNISTHDM